MEHTAPSAARGLDITSFNPTPAADQGHTIELVDPATGTPFGTTITIAGEDSERMQEWNRQLFNRVQREERVAKKSGRPIERSFDELQEQLVQKAVALTIGWTGMVAEGRPLEFSATAAERLYRAQRWVRDLVLEEARVSGNFAKR